MNHKLLYQWADEIALHLPARPCRPPPEPARGGLCLDGRAGFSSRCRPARAVSLIRRHAELLARCLSLFRQGLDFFTEFLEDLSRFIGLVFHPDFRFL